MNGSQIQSEESKYETEKMVRKIEMLEENADLDYAKLVVKK